MYEPRKDEGKRGREERGCMGRTAWATGPLAECAAKASMSRRHAPARPSDAFRARRPSTQRQQLSTICIQTQEERERKRERVRETIWGGWRGSQPDLFVLHKGVQRHTQQRHDSAAAELSDAVSMAGQRGHALQRLEDQPSARARGGVVGGVRRADTIGRGQGAPQSQRHDLAAALQENELDFTLERYRNATHKTTLRYPNLTALQIHTHG